MSGNAQSSDEGEPGYTGSNAAGPASSFGDSEAPSAHPAITQPAAQPPAHPFWSQKGAKKPRGKRKEVGGGHSSENPPAAGVGTLVVDSEEGNGPAFTGISMRELEFARNRAQDGAESSIASDYGDDAKKPRKARRAKDFSGASAVDMMASATFGARRRELPKEGNQPDNDAEKEVDDEDEDDLEEEDSDCSDASDSMAAGIDSTVRGEHCIGCLFDREVVAVVDEFVRKNCGCMAETALYKAAAQHWINEIVKPREAEGVKVPKWNWRCA